VTFFSPCFPCRKCRSIKDPVFCFSPHFSFPSFPAFACLFSQSNFLILRFPRLFLFNKPYFFKVFPASTSPFQLTRLTLQFLFPYEEPPPIHLVITNPPTLMWNDVIENPPPPLLSSGAIPPVVSPSPFGFYLQYSPRRFAVLDGLLRPP